MLDPPMRLNRIVYTRYTLDLFADLTRSLEASILILSGKHDKIISVDGANELQSLVKRAKRLVLLSNISYVPMLEAEQQVAPYYLTFWQKPRG